MMLASLNLYLRSRPIESGGSGIGTLQLDLRVAAYIFDPQLPHHPLHILRLEAISIRMFPAELTQARDPGIWIAWVWVKAASVGL